jgi:hypothetical protein
LGFSLRNSGWRSYYSNNYNDNISFFIELVRRPKVEVSPARSVDRVGFQTIVRRRGIRHPSADCNGIHYSFEKRDHDGESNFLNVNTPYSFYPFGIGQDQAIGAYISQMDKRSREVRRFDTTIQASIRINGEDFTWAKDYFLRTNLSELRASRLNANELIPTRNITFSLEEVKEPSLWRRFLSSFSVTRTRIPK